MTADWSGEDLQALREALEAARELLDLPYSHGSGGYQARQALMADRAASVRNALAGLVVAFDAEDKRGPTLRGTTSFLHDTSRLLPVRYQTVEDHTQESEVKR